MVVAVFQVVARLTRRTGKRGAILYEVLAKSSLKRQSQNVATRRDIQRWSQAP